MSRRTHSRVAARQRMHALVFAALGNSTRLSLVARLARGQRRSISELTQGCKLTRQAVTKHLRVLESAGIVQSIHAGRESLFEFNLAPIAEVSDYLGYVSGQWDEALSRLKAFVED